jgi:hypothetical protein
MMPFVIEDIDRLLPPEISEQRKNRLRDGLRQFVNSDSSQEKYYIDFYHHSSFNYFLQGDLIRELRFPFFNNSSHQYEKLYFDALLISNTCDIDEANTRNVEKKAILAKLIPMEAYIDSLEELGTQKSAEILTQIKNQQFSNLLYLPPTKESKEYIAYLDDLSIIDREELNALKADINDNRIESLDFFGYYLFIFKLSYHLCRLPEVTER